MRQLRAWLIRLGGLFNKQRRERELAEELESHLQMHIEDNLRSGLTPEEARRQASIKLGGLEQTKEIYRDRRGVPLLESLLQDVHFGLRMLAKNRGFTAVAVVTLALGIGANTAIFSVIDAAMLRLLPVRHTEQLVQVGFQGKHSGQSFVGESFSYPLFQELRRHNQVFTDVSAFDYWDSFDADLANSGSGAASEPLKAELVSANFFSLLGVNAAIGRTFAPDEDNGAGAHPVAVISDALWTRRFARDPAVLGKKVRIENTPLTIVGVTPAHFNGVNPGKPCALWIPVSMEAQVAQNLSLTDSDTNWLTLMARLKPGVSLEQARAGLDVVYQENPAPTRYFKMV